MKILKKKSSKFLKNKWIYALDEYENFKML